MANASTVGFGLRTTSTVGNTPATSGQSNYKIKSGLGVGIFKNNPVSIQDASGDQGYLQDASFATTDDTGSGGAAFDNTGHAPLIGVFMELSTLIVLQANQLLLIQLQQAQHLELTIIQVATTE